MSTLENVARRHGIALLVAFGSTVTGRLHSGSDLDLGVLLEHPGRSRLVRGELDADLQALYPERKVDVALLNRADPLFLRKVTEACRLLHGSERRLHELRMYAFRRYQDHRRYLRMEREYVRRRVGQPEPG